MNIKLFSFLNHFFKLALYINTKWFLGKFSFTELNCRYLDHNATFGKHVSLSSSPYPFRFPSLIIREAPQLRTLRLMVKLFAVYVKPIKTICRLL